MATAFTSLCCPQTSAWLLLLGDKGGEFSVTKHTHTEACGRGRSHLWSETLMIGHW